MNEELNKHLDSGHSACAGCAFPVIVRTVLGEVQCPVIVVNATGCLEVTSTIYPFTAWKNAYIHSAFENASATASGIETAQKILLAKGKIKEKAKIVVFGGDGGTYDIGLQSLSGALERGHDFLYVCYDNEGYMNTGNQRSSATPFGAATETTPIGQNQKIGKTQMRKDLMEIVKAHKIAYLAQANVAFLTDLKMKARKALAIEGPTFLNVFSPCTNNWKFPLSQYVNVATLATETNFWPLYEIENGKYKINQQNPKRKPIEEFLKTQGRFKHLFSPENKETLEKIQKIVDDEWEKLIANS
jgi:pyruvate ferredoxin oxidoreductase beta subunit